MIAKSVLTISAQLIGRAEQIKAVVSPESISSSVTNKTFVDPSCNGGADGEKNISGPSKAIDWGDVAGLEGAKRALEESVFLPMKFPHMFSGSRKSWKGILLYGVSKTAWIYSLFSLQAQERAILQRLSLKWQIRSLFLFRHQTSCPNISATVKSKLLQFPSLRLLCQTYVPFRTLREIFKQAISKKPAILFIDEIDSMCSSRQEGEHEATKRLKTEFLIRMTGMKQMSGGENEGQSEERKAKGPRANSRELAISNPL